MTETTRIPAAEITGLKGAVVKRFARRALGQVPTTLHRWRRRQPMSDFALVRTSF